MLYYCGVGIVLIFILNGKWINTKSEFTIWCKDHFLFSFRRQLFIFFPPFKHVPVLFPLTETAHEPRRFTDDLFPVCVTWISSLPRAFRIILAGPESMGELSVSNGYD